MKKKIFAILLIAALCVSALAIVAACDPDDTGKTPGEVPTEDGKVTFYCTIEDYDVPDYASPFLLGLYADVDGDGNWAPGLEMKNIEGTNIWYVIIDITPEELLANCNDETKDEGKWDNYMVDLGYNANSGLPEDKQGEAGQYFKSDETAAPGGMDNPSYEYTGGNTVNLGAQHFTLNPIAPPVRIDTQAVVKFSEPLGANADVQIRGGFNGWGNNGETVKATPNADRKEWSLALNDMVVSSYEFKVLVCTDTTQIKQDEKKDDPWNATLENGTTKAYIEIHYGTGSNSNIKYTFANRDDGAPTYILGYDTVIDLSTAVDQKIDLKQTVVVTFQVTFQEALADGLTVWIGGDGPFGDWNQNVPAPKMTSTDRQTWTLTLEVDKALLGTYVNCKVVVVPGDKFDWNTGTNFGKKEGATSTAADAGNYTFTLQEGTVTLFDKEVLEMPAAPAE